MDDNQLIDGFLMYLAQDECNIVTQALKSDLGDILSSDEFSEIMEQFKRRTLVTSENVRAVIKELAKQELHQKPHLMASCWTSIFGPLRQKLPFPGDLRTIYDKLKPTNKKIISIIDSTPESDAERDSLQYFKRYVRALDIGELKHLLQFLTGSELLIVDKITVTFKKDQSNVSRTPIAHTCGPCLELPSTYNNFCELREEFSNILEKTTWEMDTV